MDIVPTNAPGRATDHVERELSKQRVSVIRLLELLISQAASEKASDIHMSYSVDSLIIRFRREGELRRAYEVRRSIANELFSRVKIVSGLRIDEHRLPQDGTFSLALASGSEMYVRVSLIPAYHGENVVLRLLSSHEDLPTLKSLGMREEHQRQVREKLLRLEGLMLLSGPTGSGKTTTLYSLLHSMHAKELSLITIEDPIERSLQGVVQVQGGSPSGVPFSEGIRSIVRQDPDLIAIGEIRDKETAELAIHASLTGHAVLSTLHSGSATAALYRLLHMGIEPYLIASTVSVVVNQRLVKGSGGRGRVGLFEVLVLHASMREAVLRKASLDEMNEVCTTHGMMTLLDDGVDKAQSGIILPSELTRIGYGGGI